MYFEYQIDAMGVLILFHTMNIYGMYTIVLVCEAREYLFHLPFEEVNGKICYYLKY